MSRRARGSPYILNPKIAGSITRPGGTLRVQFSAQRVILSTARESIDSFADAHYVTAGPRGRRDECRHGGGRRTLKEVPARFPRQSR